MYLYCGIFKSFDITEQKGWQGRLNFVGIFLSLPSLPPLRRVHMIGVYISMNSGKFFLFTLYYKFYLVACSLSILMMERNICSETSNVITSFV